MESLIDRYRERLPVGDETPVVSLGEGSTPLLRAPRLSERLGADVYLKWEGANPTGSFKDRGMTVAISKALEQGAHAVICASTGNTAASAAAYAARAGLAALVLQPADAVASGKLAQARALGARVLEVRGSFEEALAAARDLAARGTHLLVNSLNPHRLEGQKTAAFEIVEELRGAPEVLALPYGGGGNLCAYARGFTEAGAGMPRIVAGEAADRGTTAASAIRIAEPAHAASAIAAVGASGGEVVSLTDDEIMEAWSELSHHEGVFCEPSSAAGLAAFAKLYANRGARTTLQQSVASVVCVVTGHGLKDPEAAATVGSAPVIVEPNPDAIAEAAR
jgi:threonine synthase